MKELIFIKVVKSGGMKLDLKWITLNKVEKFSHRFQNFIYESRIQGMQTPGSQRGAEIRLLKLKTGLGAVFICQGKGGAQSRN